MKFLKPFLFLSLVVVTMTGCTPGATEEPIEPTEVNEPVSSTEAAMVAPVRITEYFDFACGYCARSSAVNTALKAKYGDKLEITHKSMNNYSQSTPVHKAFVCVAEQDQAKGDMFVAKYFADYMQKYDNESIEAVATIVGADVDEMNQCMDADSTETTLAKQKEEAERMGARGTPFFVINEYTIQPGFLDEAAFSRQIEKILTAAGESTATATEKTDVVTNVEELKTAEVVAETEEELDAVIDEMEEIMEKMDEGIEEINAEADAMEKEDAMTEDMDTVEVDA
jgi:predicted DsbA family dithiol-disulfide isomerase